MQADEVDAFQAELPADKRPGNSKEFARELVRAGKLTRYQAQAVYQGKTKGLNFGQYPRARATGGGRHGSGV